MRPPELSGRRPLKSRDMPFFKNLAAWLARSGVTPNGISCMTIVFSAIAGAAFAGTAFTDGWVFRFLWLVGAVCIQLRLMGNLLDGMVAIEGKKGGPVGELWNEAPDRLSDALTLIGAGFAAGSDPFLGFSAALVAVLVAYVRALGASVGAGQIFIGPQAKQQRMAVVTAASVASAVVPDYSKWLICAALTVVTAGGLITVWRRLARIAIWLRDDQEALSTSARHDRGPVRS
ncbi:MAG TPA: CDP-alcohol phosphatidyltransferase family protein [Chthoniobacterales bacterium]